jgi:hypothetical protein
MNPMLRSFLILLLLAGCAAPEWTKPGATAEARTADENACAQEAQAKYPPRFVPAAASGMAAGVGPGYSCIPERGCIRTGPGYLPPTGTVDLNDAPRRAAVAQCMESRGWTR